MMLRNIITSQAKLLRPLPTCTSKSSFSSENKNKYLGPRHEINETVEKYTEDDFPMENPLKRAFRLLKRDFVVFNKQVDGLTKERMLHDPEDYGPYSPNIFPGEADVLIIGGGVIGSSIAFWLKHKIPGEFKVVVVEKDSTYKTASSALSVGGLRQQFSAEENIEMSLYGAEFLRNADKYLHIEGEPKVDVQFRPYGYLFLATEKGAEIMTENSRLQNSLGAKNILMSPAQLKAKFPWLDTKDIALGCLGVEKEGWFDPWALLTGFRKKAMSLGAKYITGEVKGFIGAEMSPYISYETGKSIHERLYKAVVQLPSGEKRTVQFSLVIVACGAQSAKVARMLGIGTGTGPMSVPLPVEPRKRYVYCFHCPDGPGLNTPLTIDPSGAYFRREGLGGLYICGQAPDPDKEPPVNNLKVDENFFYETVWPNLAKRVPSFEKLKLRSSWAGFYEYNYYDANGIVGIHPYIDNIVFATGFSGHGIQQAPAVGRAISELILDARYTTIDLSRLGFDRFLNLEPLDEIAIV